MNKPQWPNLVSTWVSTLQNQYDFLPRQQLSKSQWQYLLGALAALGMLIFLLVKSSSISLSRQQSYQNSLNFFKEQDAFFSQELLNSKHELFTSYDLLNQYLTSLETTNQKLKDLPIFLTSGDQQALERLLRRNTTLVEQKANLLEEFKSENAALKNSLRYLPALTTEILQNTESSSLAVKLDALLQQILLYNLTSNEELAPKIKSRIASLANNNDGGNQSLLNLELRHANVIVEHKPKVEQVTQELLELPTRENIIALEQAYNSSYQKAIRTANFFRLSAYLWSLLILGGVAYLVINYLIQANRRTLFALESVRQTESALQKLNEELEVRVEKRTAQLQDSIATAQEARQQAEQANVRSQLLKDISLKLYQTLDAEVIYKQVVREVRAALKVDRVVIYTFDDHWKGTITAEDLLSGIAATLGVEIADPCFAEQYVEKYRQGRVLAIADISQADLHPCHYEQLNALAVKANLVAPILVGDKLTCLLIAHKCFTTREWKQAEINFFAQVAAQVGLALERVQLLEQQRHLSTQQQDAKEKLQQQALALLTQVQPVSQGDLTVQAQVRDNEIGTVAASYNDTIASLRQIVTQVQDAAEQVTTTTENNDTLVAALSTGALQQSEQINIAFEQIEAMVASIGAIAAHAEQAEIAVADATKRVQKGDKAMNQTLDGIMALQETVTATAEKVKSLGATSEKISQVVKLISNFSRQTNLVALNASIEAARAGMEGQGFGVVAQEVRALAQGSATATVEITALVEQIQLETQAVVKAMETSAEKVIAGTQLVTNTRQTLEQITTASDNINQLVAEITQATVEQSQSSQVVSQTMTKVATIAQETSVLATDVSLFFQELLCVASNLQASVDQFKVN